MRRNPIISRQFREAASARESLFTVPEVSRSIAGGTFCSSFAIALRISSAAVLMLVRCRRTHIRMTENPLGHHIRHTQAVVVTSKAASCSVPALPFGDFPVAFVLVIGHGMLGLSLLALGTTVESWQHDSPQQIIQVERLPHGVCEDRPGFREFASEIPANVAHTL